MDDSHKKRLYESNHEMPRLDGYHKSRHHLKPIKQSKMSRNLQMVVNIDTTINGITTTLKLSLATPLDGTSNALHAYLHTNTSGSTRNQCVRCSFSYSPVSVMLLGSQQQIPRILELS